MIAVLTICPKEFKIYKRTQPVEIQEKLRKISVLKDIKERNYTKAVLIRNHENVTDRVIKDVLSISDFEELDLRY